MTAEQAGAPLDSAGSPGSGVEAEHSRLRSESALIGPVPAPGLHVMTWNIRRRSFALHPRRADRWRRRAPGVRSLLKTERPALLGVQEALADQAGFVAESLGGGHRFVGHGRGPRGHGEASPIYYDTERLELLDWEQRALSDTPHHPGSRSWGNLIPRIMVVARFRDRATATSFLAVNTHLDHLSLSSRLSSVESIRELITGSELPGVVLGDMNAGPRSAPIRKLLRGEALVDAWAVAERRESPEWGTFANYQEPRRDRARIDWIMTTPQVRVGRAAINTRRGPRGWASDHLPVQAVLHLDEAGGAR